MTIEPITAFLIGLAGSMHCIGMCGGIVTALRHGTATSASVPLTTFSYHTGRIASYGIAGALAGSIGLIFGRLGAPAGIALQMISGIMLILLGLYISQWWRGLRHLENLGRHVWRYLAPLSRRILPIRTSTQALLYGAIWGWLPCGLVYSTLSWSLASADPISGASIMIFFGLGTLPSMLGMAMFAKQLTLFATSKLARSIIGLSLIGVGGYTIYLAIN